jgi:ribosomal protein S18 acetylase RimI-like enzyme
MNAVITIRDAGPDDLPALVGFNLAMAWETEHKVLALDKIQPGVQALLLRPEYGFYVIAELEAHPVGALMITTEWSDWRNAWFWWIQSVYVKPGFRKQGVYRALYAEIKARARSNPMVCGCRLYVAKDNSGAQKTYLKLGMKETNYKIFEELI